MDKKPFYGIDGLNALITLMLVAFAFLGAAWAVLHFDISFFAVLTPRVMSVLFVIFGISYLCPVIAMIISSLRWKLKQRDRLLNLIEWTGDERVLDVGCGRGLLVIGAAKHLTSGQSVGIDIWKSADLLGNSRAAAQKNAELEGVADKVEIIDADARKMPFGDNTFDVIVSSMAVHNIRRAVQRKKALAEIARVLKPGGTVLIQDFQYTDQYAQDLIDLGLLDVRVSDLQWGIFPPTRIVYATK